MGEVFSFEVSDKYVPKVGDEVWWMNPICEPAKFIFTTGVILNTMAERGFLFPTEAECQKFADHCLNYFDEK